jgi:hypothetical protein
MPRCSLVKGGFCIHGCATSDWLYRNANATIESISLIVLLRFTDAFERKDFELYQQLKSSSIAFAVGKRLVQNDC